MSETKKDAVSCSFCQQVNDKNKKLFFTSDTGVVICENCLKTAYEAYLEKKNCSKGNIGTDVLTPSAIKNFLDDYVIGQEKAKKILSVAVYNHTKLLNYYDSIQDGDVEVEKSNIIIVGPSGSGKTHIIRTLARILDVPYCIADATTLTESGYVGNDVEIVLQKLINAANGDIKKAERGIVYIDEIDKKCSRNSENVSITRDVSGEGVQQALLKLLEGTKVDVPLTGSRKHPHGETVEVDTSRILFVVGGAFPGIEEIIKKRLNYRTQQTVGIKIDNNIDNKTAKNVQYNDVIDKVNTDDLKKYGLIPEFIGRLPIICPLHELTESQLCEILTEPKNALIKQYKTLMQYDNVDLEFQEDAVMAIASKAIANKTGARGLRAILENLLLSVMYDAPDRARKNSSSSIIITKKCVEDGTMPAITKTILKGGTRNEEARIG